MLITPSRLVHCTAIWYQNMLDSSSIEAAVIEKLASDSTLTALLQAGASVFTDEAPAGSTKFVIVSLVDEQDVQQFERRSFEDALFLVEARMLSTAGGNIKAAAARIDSLLDPQPPLPPATLSVAGYRLMTMHRESRVRNIEVDEVDSSIRWSRRGGHYRISMST